MPGCILRDAPRRMITTRRGSSKHPSSRRIISRRLSKTMCRICGRTPAAVSAWTWATVSLAMPSNRNAFLGVQMWKYHITGFLHWAITSGTRSSPKRLLIRSQGTDAGGAFPVATDFPSSRRKRPLPSLRQKVFAMALYDMRALSLAEEKLGRESVLKLLGDGESMTFATYPRTSSIC